MFSLKFLKLVKLSMKILRNQCIAVINLKLEHNYSTFSIIFTLIIRTLTYPESLSIKEISKNFK